MTSPIPAYRLPEPPSTRMQRISLAPVLSATLSRDSCWITSTPASVRPVARAGVCPVARTRAGACTFRCGPHAGRFRCVAAGCCLLPGSGYFAFSRISATRQRLVADSGLVSISRTRSPIPQAFAPSCALYFLVRRMTLPYLGCLTRSSTWTTTVLSILSLTTRPSRTLRYPRAGSAALSCAALSCTGFASLIARLLFHDHDAELPLAL